jgi:hypothetical protein
LNQKAPTPVADIGGINLTSPTTNAQTAGVGHVVATGAVALDTDTRGVDVQWSENATADSFGKNLVFAWCESRYATSVYSPLGSSVWI